jgi:hypothetical protein
MLHRETRKQKPTVWSKIKPNLSLNLALKSHRVNASTKILSLTSGGEKPCQMALPFKSQCKLILTLKIGL